MLLENQIPQQAMYGSHRESETDHLVVWWSTLIVALFGVQIGAVVASRWMMLLMGLFAIYCGFLYNECFAIPMVCLHSGLHQPTNQDMASDSLIRS
jgi:hypothetical protein